MSDRRTRSKAKTKTLAWTAAGLVHLVIIGAVVFNFASEPESIQVFDADVVADTVKATVVNEDDIKNRQDQLKKQDREKQRQKALEEKRLRDLQRKAEQERQRIADLQDKKQREEIAAQEAERKRKEIKLKAEQEELERLKKEEERRKREEALRKKRAAEAAEKKRVEEAERIKREQQEFEAQQRLNQLLEEEARILQEQEQARLEAQAAQQALRRTTTVMSKYGALIEKAVNEKLRAAPGTEPWRKTKVNIKVSPLGEVESVRVIESSGSAGFDRSAETAVLQASPLPFPTQAEDMTAHTKLQNLNITIRP